MQSNDNTNKPANFVEKTIDKLMNFENSEILQKTNQMMAQGHKVMDNIDAQYRIEPMSIEKLLQNFSPIIDEKVIQYAKTKNLKPIGGEIKFSISPTNENEIITCWDFYFIDTNQQYKKISSEKTITKSSLTEEAYKNIKNNQLTFEIEPPK